MKFTNFVQILSTTLGLALAFTPEVSYTETDERISAINYFDDSPNILKLRSGSIYISENNGIDWKLVDSIKNQEIIDVIIHPFHKNRAYAVTDTKEQFYTEDNGLSWKSVVFDKAISYFSQIQFNSANPDYLLIDYYDCSTDIKCYHYTFYSKDNMKSVNLLRDDVESCAFVKSSKSFTFGSDERILCSKVNYDARGYIIDSALVASDDWFKTEEEIGEKNGLSKANIIFSVTAIESFIVVEMQLDKYNPKSKLSLYISKDGQKFNKANLEIELERDLFEYLPSTANSLYIKDRHFEFSALNSPASNVYASDSSGLQFRKIADIYSDNIFSVSIEKIQTIDGAWFCHSAMDQQRSSKLRTKITLDDGFNWQYLRMNNDENCKGDDACSVNLLITDERDGAGKFVTGPTPGIVMGVGSKGEYLDEDFTKLKTFISRDGGISWDFALDEPCAFAFGDQGNIIMAVPYYGNFNFSVPSIKFSLDQGKTWEAYQLPKPILPLTLTTTVDGTSTNFLLSGFHDTTPGNSNDNEFNEIIYAFDFSGAFSKTCDENDFEEWYARSEFSSTEPVCIDGHKEKFSRRKQSAKCFVNKLYEDVKSIDENCFCEDRDFECAEGFIKNDNGKCAENYQVLAKICGSQNKKSKLSLKSRVKSNGNTCVFGPKKEKDFVENVEIDCSLYKEPDAGSIKTMTTSFNGVVSQYNYLEKSEKSSSECLVLRTSENEGYVSYDGGKVFEKIEMDEELSAYYLGYDPDTVYLVTSSAKLYVSKTRGRRFDAIITPSKPNKLGMRVLTFDKRDENRFIWYGDGNCDYTDSFDCGLIAYITLDGGVSFKKLMENVRMCDFGSSFLDDEYIEGNENLIFCQLRNKNGLFSLESSKNYFESSEILFSDIVGYAITGRFFVVATVVEDNSLSAKVTVDGVTFADAEFPPDFAVDKEQAYTILESSSKAIFVHVTTNNVQNSEYGSILKSNSNGTSYVLSLDYVNRDNTGYVDFEKIEGLEGLAVVNTVKNPEEADKGNSKKLTTQITHNDGGEWSLIPPPAVDSEGVKYDCRSKPLLECALHLHGYTERKDYRDTFSSGSAVGVMMALGNVGPHLDKDLANTFLTNDGGITWKEVKKGRYMWEFGDMGTIIVLVSEDSKTDSITYSLDEGHTWNEFQFTESPVTVFDISTVPSDSSRKFLLFSTIGLSTVVYSIDFSDVHSRQCTLDLDNPLDGDYEFWTPKHPFISDNCLFGHESKYLRRIPDHTDCFIGSAPLSEGFKITRNCPCTRRDYECDYNYFKDLDGTCKLVQGHSPIDHSEICKKPDVFEYFEPTGYRKIPLSTCEGGREFDNWNARPCPGMEKYFDIIHNRNMTGTKVFFLVFVPLFVFIFATWFVYDRGIRRNGGFARFGQIRLDDDDFHPIENNDVDKVVNKIVSGGIIVVASIISFVQVLRKVDKALINKVKTLVTGRPRRGNYVSFRDLGPEEDELFEGFEDEDAVDEADDFIDSAYNDDSDTHLIADDSVFDLDESDNSDANTVEFDAEAESRA